MSPWLIAGVGVIYAYVAVEQYIRGNIPMAVVYAGYAFSNAGFYFALR